MVRQLLDGLRLGRQRLVRAEIAAQANLDVRLGLPRVYHQHIIVVVSAETVFHGLYEELVLPDGLIVVARDAVAQLVHLAQNVVRLGHFGRSLLQEVHRLVRVRHDVDAVLVGQPNPIHMIALVVVNEQVIAASLFHERVSQPFAHGMSVRHADRRAETGERALRRLVRPPG